MDTALVVRAQHGDEEAFASLAVACGDRLHAVAHRILRDIEQRIWLLDVGGTILLVNADLGDDSYPADIKEMLRVVESLKFE